MTTNAPIAIADIHCDLLLYLASKPGRSPYDPVARCSVPQLRQGGVKTQILAIFTETGTGSTLKGAAQAAIFQKLPILHPEAFVHYREGDNFFQNQPISIIPAVENASGFCEEQENLEGSLKNLDFWQKKFGKFLYMSLTWNTENRFGGGAHTDIGLKEDGKRMMQYLSQRGIALDLSHASDRLAMEAINYIDQAGLKLALIASHSNLREVHHAPRNLPDELAIEIIKRKGIIGFNFIKMFIGPADPKYFVLQLEHAIKLGCLDGLCFGADFFYDEDLSPSQRKGGQDYFFNDYGHAGTYTKVLQLWREAKIVSDAELKAICHHNFQRYMSAKTMSF